MIKDIIIHIEDALLTVAQGHGRRRGDGNEEPAGLRDGDLRSVATFKKRQESDWSGRPGDVSCSHPESKKSIVAPLESIARYR